jgi:hypothetical protein
MIADRLGDPNKQWTIKRCENFDKSINKTSRSKEFN